MDETNPQSFVVINSESLHNSEVYVIDKSKAKTKEVGMLKLIAREEQKLAFVDHIKVWLV